MEADGRIVVSNSFVAAAVTSDSLMLAEVQRIGTVDGGPQAFGDVTGLTGDGRTIYVSDRLVKEITAFGTDGEVLRRFGRRGEGPGELRHVFPVGILWQEPNRIWVGEPPSLILFDSLGSPAAKPVALPWVWPWRGHADTLGSLYTEYTETGRVEMHAQASVNIRSRNIVRHTPTRPSSGQDTGTILSPDTLSLPLLESPARTLRRGSNYEIRQLPMRPRILWSASPDGTIWLANTAEYRLHEVAFSGDTVRTVELDRPQTPISARERDSLAAESGFPVRELPRYRPMMNRLDVAPDGWMWVWRTAGDGFEWDIFDACGRFAGTVSPPVRLDRTPMQVLRDGQLLAVTKNELDVEFVVRLRLEYNDGTALRTARC